MELVYYWLTSLLATNCHSSDTLQKNPVQSIDEMNDVKICWFLDMFLNFLNVHVDNIPMAYHLIFVAT